MATKRVIFQSNGASPLRISTVGADASNAQFNQLIFDGNQPPLLLWTTGWMSCLPMQFNDLDTLLFSDGPTLPASPAGTTPIFLSSTRQLGIAAGTGDTNNANQVPHRYFTDNGTGMGVFDLGNGTNVITAMNFNRDNISGGIYGYNPNGPTGGVPLSGIFNYAIMLNVT